MSKVLIIGAGGVGRVVAHKCAALGDVFSDICLASRTKEKADQIASELARPIQTARLDADKVEDTVSLIRSFSPRMVIHVSLHYQYLSIMEDCLQTEL
ncbi:MAG: saccharopine dehydrogenase NADP-binding domain-containing protein, partial [Limisphaerales bacterium]